MRKLILWYIMYVTETLPTPVDSSWPTFTYKNTSLITLYVESYVYTYLLLRNLPNRQANK